MTGKYKGLKVEIIGILTDKYRFMTHPVVVQVKIKYKTEKGFVTDYVDGNEVIFLNH